ncbi:MAG: hypothetical protein KBT47_05590, partial [Armatimonadetes bacterium]|nr:hypothetical protein [Candidatus Hippobium faecium]
NDYIMSKEITRDGNMAEININMLTEKQDKITIEAYEYPKMKLLGKSEVENNKGKLALSNVTSKTDILFKVRFPNKDFEAFSPGVAVLGEETQYKITPPKKIKNIEKPELTVRKQNEIPNILEAKGLFANTYIFKEISQKQGWEYTPSYYSIGEMGTRLAYFPETYDYETVNKYDLIIINHIPADAYNESTWDFLYDYVSYGGKILFIGGPMCICGYDKDNDYSKKLLPFTYDRLAKKKYHKKGRKLDKLGLYEYSSDIKTKDEVKPNLFRENIGKGSIYFFTPLPLSQNLENECFWNSPNYIDYMPQIINLLIKGE